ncbi:uncharacterized protein LOC107809425 [Nicotiana tabacum]|uniref:Uncharacterized protein LOC107809425 n=1 Tax=Nicotiana tabacum TaxID=4097 RepID=A0A1S4BKZ5_TOBAC|nr:PREDICTED: uncharacterized protein LOC107809425 [Nicotiana tabacum]
MKKSLYTNIPPSYVEFMENLVVEKLGLEYVQEKELHYLTDEEIKGIKDLVGSAILDPDVKGGLRWPFGKDYDVIRVDHTIAKSYRNQPIRFKLRHADRFDFTFSTGQVAREIFLKMPGIISQLRQKKTWCLKC